MIKLELTEQDLAEWSGRLDAMVRAGGLATVEHAMFFLSKLEAATAAEMNDSVTTPSPPDDTDHQRIS